jgi:hypothetical protein
MDLDNVERMVESASADCMTGSYCHLYLAFRHRALLDEIETEIINDHQQSVRKAILHHILLNLEERKRLAIETCPVDYPAIIIRAPVPWHCTFMTSSQMLDHKLFIINPISLCLRDLWESQ